MTSKAGDGEYVWHIPLFDRFAGGWTRYLVRDDLDV